MEQKLLRVEQAREERRVQRKADRVAGRKSLRREG
jgi:hypothetical protein